MQRARTQEAKDQRRKALLTAALDEFYDRGFTAARMDDIARRAGLSKGSVYLYFDSKDTLFTELVKEYALPNVERLEAMAGQADSATGAIRMLLGFAPVLVRETVVPKIMKVLIADAPAFPKTVTAYRKNVIERGLGLITATLRKASDNGEFKIANPELTARLVVAPMIFSAIWKIAFEHDADARLDIKALFALHEKMLLTALSSGGAA
ncbi:MAG: TetR/AcrR family transcriptional regulator [Pseudomonadota bacterium]